MLCRHCFQDTSVGPCALGPSSKEEGGEHGGAGVDGRQEMGLRLARFIIPEKHSPSLRPVWGCGPWPRAWSPLLGTDLPALPKGCFFTSWRGPDGQSLSVSSSVKLEGIGRLGVCSGQERGEPWLLPGNPPEVKHQHGKPATLTANTPLYPQPWDSIVQTACHVTCVP